MKLETLTAILTPHYGELATATATHALVGLSKSQMRNFADGTLSRLMNRVLPTVAKGIEPLQNARNLVSTMYELELSDE